MDRTEQYFIEALKGFLCGRGAGSPTVDIQWKSLARLAKIHAVTGIIGHTISSAEGVPAEVAEAFRKKAFSTVRVSSAHIALGEAILTKLAESGISCIPFKGAVIRNLYPVPELRTFSDIDILVSEADFEKAHSLLIKNGFEHTDGQVGVRGYKKDGFHFEIHSTLAGDMESISRGEEAFFGSVQDHITSEHSLEPEYHLAYCLWHLTKHLSSCGAGVRMFMDIAALCNAREYDWEKVMEYLKELGITKAAKSIFFLCGRWFGTEVPSSLAFEADEATIDAMEQYVITAGTFGYNARSTGASRLRNSAAEKDAAKAKRGIVREMFFPSAEYMAKLYPWYSGRKLFTPFMWVYRWFHLLFTRRKNSLKNLSDVVHAGQDQLDEAKLLQRLGWVIQDKK